MTGNFEGFFRNDNGQSDPGISSLYDHPTNDPTYTAIGAPQFGYVGDIRFLGTPGNGPLALDRTHDVKVYGSYAFDMGLNLSPGLELESGAPLTAFAAHPVYDDGGEIPLTPRGAGFQTSNGFQTRTPWTKPVNAGASYNVKVGGRNLVLIADAFNIFNTQTILDYNSFSELRFGVPNPDFGGRVRRRLRSAAHDPTAVQNRRAVRVLRVSHNGINTHEIHDISYRDTADRRAPGAAPDDEQPRRNDAPNDSSTQPGIFEGV